MQDDSDASLYRRVAWHVLPWLLVGYLIAFIDRSNIGFAKLQMVQDIGLSESAYGLGASLFFIGYLLFEVPSNLVLVRVGPRIWLSRIMISWGLVTIALAFTPDGTTFYILRFLLGAAEAGYYPGLLYLLTLWFPSAYRGRMISYFVLGSVVANVITGPISGYLLDASGVLGLRGWQWIFVATGLPAIITAGFMLRFLPDRPEDADFLSDSDRARLLATMQSERAAMPPVPSSTLKALLDPRVLAMTLLFCLFTMSAYGFSYWLPTVVKGMGVSNAVNGWLNTIPWLLVGAALLWLGAKRERSANTTVFIVYASLLGAAAFIASYYLPSSTARFAALCLAVVCIFIAQPCFWTLPGRFLAGASAAAGFAAINSVGNLGGFAAQNVVPMIRDMTGSIAAPLLFLAAALACRGLLAWVVVAYVLPKPQAALATK